MKKLFFTLITATFCLFLQAQSDYYLSLSKPNQQFKNALWKNNDGTAAFAVHTAKRDILGDRKEVSIYVESQEKYTLQRKKTNRILRNSENGDILVYRPFKYVLPNGQVLTRRIKKAGRALHLLDNEGSLIASAETRRHPQTRRHLEISIHQNTNYDEILAAMLSLDILDQDRAFYSWDPFILCF